MLNCRPHDLPILVSVRRLKSPEAVQLNSVKRFAVVEVLELTKDLSWLAKMTNAVSHRWKQKIQPRGLPTHRGVEIGQPMEFGLPA